MLKVILAGYTMDADVMEELKDLAQTQNPVDIPTVKSYLNGLTPETISAAYARISRDPAPVNELRKQAVDDVAQAIKSNEAIVFGMGHHSVAEHVQLNFDILGISRLAIEALEEARLCAYTEKSQRYITLDGDFVLPVELDETAEISSRFQEMIFKQNEVYKKAVPILMQYHKDQVAKWYGQYDEDRKIAITCEGRAKEDARYVLSMATEGQLGFSVNARNLEYIIRKLSCHPLQEVRDLSKQLYKRSIAIVPSLIRFADSEDYFNRFGKRISNEFLRDRLDIGNILDKYIPHLDGLYYDKTPISLICNTPDPDLHILASLIHSSSIYSYSMISIRRLVYEQPAIARALIRDLFENLTEFDAVYREFEHVSFTFELVVSSSAFAQWKRHRMVTTTKQDYDPRLGYTYPKAIIDAGLTSMFREVYEESTKTWEALNAHVSRDAADYVLTNGHRRRILITANLRELYHIARLRIDKHAQWEIREQVNKMIEIVKEVAPLTSILACGKDQFADLRKQIYGE